MCKNTNFTYIEKLYNDTIGIQPYTDVTQFSAYCMMHRWSNDKVRMNYFLGLNPKSRDIVGHKDRVILDSSGTGRGKIIHLEEAGDHELKDGNEENEVHDEPPEVQQKNITLYNFVTFSS